MKMDMIDKKKITIATILFLVIFSWVGVLDRYSDNYTDKAIVQAGSAYAISRGINGIVSVLQSSTISGGVGVAEGSMTVGEILDPLNDLIERFSTVMIWVLSSLVLQKVLLLIASKPLFSSILSVLGFISLMIVWYGKNNNYQMLLRLFMLFVLIRFSLAVVLILNSSVDNMYLYNQIVESNNNLKIFQINLKNIQKSTSLSEEDFLESEEAINEYKNNIEKINREKLPSLDKELSIVDSKLKEANRICVEISDKIPWTKKFSKNEELNNAKNEVSTLEEKKEVIENEIEEQEDVVQDLTERIGLLERKINGDDIGIISKLYNIKDNFTFSTIENKVAGVSDNIIKLLVLFVLKSILIPLLFISLFIHTIKSIWRMNFYQIAD